MFHAYLFLGIGRRRYRAAAMPRSAEMIIFSPAGRLRHAASLLYPPNAVWQKRAAAPFVRLVVVAGAT